MCWITGNAIGKWNHYEKIIENKTEQWFGSSLATSKDLRSVIVGIQKASSLESVCG